MGKMNLLRADYIGQVGQTYGVRQYNKSIVKAVPFSHTPHNDAQTNAVRAFEKLNRFSAYVARTFWRYLNLSDKTMYRHNAVAKWLKPCVSNGSFELGNLVSVIPTNSSLSLTNVTIDFDTKTATVSFVNSAYSAQTTNENIFIALVADTGTVKAGGVFSSVSQTLTFTWDYTDFTTLSVVMFKSSLNGTKRVITGLCIYSENVQYVINNILYTSLMPLTASPTVENGVITFDASDGQVTDSILQLLNS